MRDRQRLLARGQRGKGDIINNPEGKPVHRQRFIEVVKDRRDIVGQNVLTAKRVAAADNQRRIVVVVEGVFHIQAQRFSLSAGLFGAVKDGNALYGFRQLSEKVGQRKGRNRCTLSSPTFSPAAFSVSTTS